MTTLVTDTLSNNYLSYDIFTNNTNMFTQIVSDVNMITGNQILLDNPV